MRYIVYGIYDCEQCPEFDKYVDLYNDDDYTSICSVDGFDIISEDNICSLSCDYEIKEKIIKILKEHKNSEDYNKIADLLMTVTLEDNMKYKGDYY